MRSSPCYRCKQEYALHSTSDTLCDACLKDMHNFVFCEHANECPTACPCPADCICKRYTCKPPGKPELLEVCNCAHGCECPMHLEPEETPGRPSWDDIWIRLAESLSRRSTCERLSVGCVVVSADNSSVLGIGYNGGPKGLNNGCLSLTPGACGHLHAEINALIKANYRDAFPKKAYVTTEPCYGCAVALVNADVQEVCYRYSYRSHDGLDLLAAAGVKVRQLP